jgi:hypothetical protein
MGYLTGVANSTSAARCLTMLAADGRQGSSHRRTERSLIGHNIFDQVYIIAAGDTGNASGIPTFISTQ